MLTVTVCKPRPDHRVFGDLLFGPGRNLDSDGDADPVWSRNWRDLYLKDRESARAKVEIYAPDDRPTVFEIISEDIELAELAALYLYLYCGQMIERDGISVGQNELSTLKVKYTEQLARAEKAVWHKSSEQNPFPNLRGGI